MPILYRTDRLRSAESNHMPASLTPNLTWSSDRSIRIATDDPARVDHALRAFPPPGLIDLTPGFDCLQIELDPLAADAKATERAIASALDRLTDIDPPASREHTIPVCYNPAFAPDLAALAERAKLTTDQVITLHTSATYRVEVIGFSPGFGYLSGLHQSLHAPRLDSPRTRIPAGSVGIAGEHTGVYPHATPGGWNLIGRTPLTLFDPQRDPAALLAVGDTVRFESITASEFHRLTEGGSS